MTTRPARRSTYTPEELAWMRELAAIAARGIQRQDTGWAIFHGCVDWHSAVHSHWMLIRHALATGEMQHVALVRRSLFREGGLEEEARLLESRPTFEMPYGRAWLLRLVIEYELYLRDSPGPLRRLGDQALGSLLHHYQRFPPTPLDAEYANAPWALAQMLAYTRHRKRTDEEQAVGQLIRKGCGAGAARELSFTEDAAPSAGFFSRLGNWLYLMTLHRTPEEVRALVGGEHGLAPEDLAPVARLHTAHHLGMNPSRTWALAALARATGDETFGRARLRHLEAVRRTHAQHVGDLMAYDHWVPSFCMYAITEPVTPLMAGPPPGR